MYVESNLFNYPFKFINLTLDILIGVVSDFKQIKYRNDQMNNGKAKYISTGALEIWYYILPFSVFIFYNI